MPIVVLVLLALLAGAAPPAAAAATVRASTPSCDVEDRSATFEGAMHSRPGTQRMQMRFGLRALVDGDWTRVKAPGFHEWQTSDPGIARYVFTRTVENLPAPGAYRARVTFRWLGREGEVLDQRSERTPVCRMRDPRPDLEVGPVTARPGGWSVIVRNSGRSDAGAFEVAAAVDGVERRPRRMAGLEAGEEASLFFEGPCTTALRVAVDSGEAIDERDEDDNVLESSCPGTR